MTNSSEIIIQTHRGMGFSAPENTLESFIAAWTLGDSLKDECNLLAIPECDVRQTKDGVIVTFHDNDFRRLAPDAPEEIADTLIEDLAWDQIRDLDVGKTFGEQFSGQRIPKLEDIFREMAKDPKRQMYLDIKKVSFEDMRDLARSYGISKQVRLASTKYDEIRRWMQLTPESGTLHWMGGTEESLKLRIEALEKEDFKSITHLQTHVNYNPDGSINRSEEFMRWVSKLTKARGIEFQVLIYGQNTLEIYKQLIDWGVQSFATDEPDMTIEILLNLTNN